MLGHRAGALPYRGGVTATLLTGIGELVTNDPAIVGILDDARGAGVDQATESTAVFDAR